MKDLDKYRGCLIGGAAGDALGFAVEFLRDDMILARYGYSGITEYTLNHGVAEISDDTQMTLFTATGLLTGTAMGATPEKMDAYSGYILAGYKDWYRTQTEKWPLSEGPQGSWLANLPKMFVRRAPGHTCQSALRCPEVGTMENPVNNSKGCGGVMRVAPIGLYFGKESCSIEKIDRLGAEAAALTHGHPLGYIPAAGLVHMIHLLAHHDLAVLDAAKDMMQAMALQFSGNEYLSEFLELMDRAIKLSQNRKISAATAIEILGQGWVAEETLAIALYSALKYSDNFDRALIASVNHSGDSDSTGAVTGNILGAHLGFSGIPRKYLKKLEWKKTILELADDLYYGGQPLEPGIRDEKWEQKYVSMTYPPRERKQLFF